MPVAHAPSSNITWSDISVTQPKKKAHYMRVRQILMHYKALLRVYLS